MRRRLRAQTLPVDTGREPAPLLGTHTEQDFTLLRPMEMSAMQSALAQPHAGTVPDQQFQSGTAAVGETIGRAIARRATDRLFWISTDRRSVLQRISTGSTASNTCSGDIISTMRPAIGHSLRHQWLASGYSPVSCHAGCPVECRGRVAASHREQFEPIAVGMGITAHPPHRSVRAELPHTAPASGVDAKSFSRQRM